MTRIADGTRKGSRSIEREFAIGYHQCYGCKKETPDPPQSILDNATGVSGVSTIWPFEHWDVPGWLNIHELGHICDDCSRAVCVLLKMRRTRTVDGQDFGDMEILRGNVAKANALATEALTSDFPPPAGMLETGEYRYVRSGTTSPMWRSREDYREGQFRGQIRLIRHALLGTMPDPFE